MLSRPRFPSGLLNLFCSVLLLFALFAAQLTASGSSLGGVVCAFERTTTTGEISEVTRGSFYLSPTGRLALHVRHPVSQIMSWSDSLVVIAYPEEKRAFVVRHQGTWSPDLLFPSIAYQYVAQGLEGTGYDLVSYETVGDTTTFHWRHPQVKNAPALAANVEAKLVDGLAVAMSSFDGKQNLLSHIAFASYHEIGEFVVPLDVRRIRVTENTRSSERVLLSDPVWMEVLPDSILSPLNEGDYEVSNYDFGGNR